MNKLQVKLQNCYGIGSMDHTFDFSQGNVIVVYAPNGTMKSSLYKVLDDIKKNRNPCDKIYISRKSTASLIADGKPLDGKKIVVANAKDSLAASESVTKFLASKTIKEEYDRIWNSLSKVLKALFIKLKEVSKSSDCETEIRKTFAELNFRNIFDLLESLRLQIVTKEYPIFNFKYNDVFDKGGKVKDFLSEQSDNLTLYANKYLELMANSPLYRVSAGGRAFGTHQVAKVQSSLKDGFFEVGHKVVLDGQSDPLCSDKAFDDLIESEMLRILSDAELQKTFRDIDVALSKNAALKAFHGIIINDQSLIVHLVEYEKFRKQVWYGFLSQCKAELELVVARYTEHKDELERIYKLAESEQPIWHEVIELFNARFSVPFAVTIKNQRDAMLESESAALEFKYDDGVGDGCLPFPVAEDGSSSIEGSLSDGERRALHILQLIFEIEARKSEDDTLFVLDDVSDSFDYKNKFAIVEYIRDMAEDRKFEILALTHNFDFYRTLASRLCLNYKQNCYIAVRNRNRELTLSKGMYRNDIFRIWLTQPNGRKFVSLIPFVRNILEYTEGSNSAGYMLLTECLHIKQNIPIVQQIDLLFCAKFNATYKSATILPANQTIRDFIFCEADAIAKECSPDPVLLENKIVLSIASRLKAELFMLRKLGTLVPQNITANQTSELYQVLVKNKAMVKVEDDQIRTLARVNLVTPSTIHLNAFMYEPLIDMSIDDLLSLYGDVSRLK